MQEYFEKSLNGDQKMMLCDLKGLINGLCIEDIYNGEGISTGILFAKLFQSFHVISKAIYVFQ